MGFAMKPPWWIRAHLMGMHARRGWAGGPGPGFPMGPPVFFPGRAKVERGGVRLAILYLLAEEPMHGYQIIRELTSRTEGMWQPSPGAIYPTLQQLEDEGLVAVTEREGKKVYALTEEGRAQVGDQDEAPWEQYCPPFEKGLLPLRDLAFGVGAAVMQVAHAGTEAQLKKTKEILEEARRQIYQMLADAGSDRDRTE